MQAPKMAGMVFALALGLAGCDPAPESQLNQKIQAPPPRHPAMAGSVPVAQASTGSDAATDGREQGNLPAGHPPVSSGSGQKPPSASSGAGSAGTGAAQTATAGGGVITAGSISFTVPKGLLQEKPDNPMRLAQIRLPRAPSDAEDGLMTVSVAMGTVEANIERWRTQFEGNPAAEIASKEIAGLKVSLVRIEGNYTGMGPAAGGGGVKAGYRLWGAVVLDPQRGGQAVFLKATGPKATILQWDADLLQLASSIRPAR